DGADAFAGDLDQVVGTSGKLPGPVRIADGAVAVDPNVGPARPVGGDVSVGLLPESPGHRRPRSLHHQLPELSRDRIAVRVEHVDVHSDGWPGETTFGHLHD